MSESVLKYFGLQPVTDEETLSMIYGDTVPTEAKEKLEKYLLLLPENIMAVINAALQMKRPFLPPEVTPEMMAAQNDKVPVMNQMEVLYRCVDWAIQAKEFKMAACISFVVDRASYWSGTSKALLQVVDLIKEASPDVAIAPQVQVRKARVLKDEGDLHGAMKVLDKVLLRPQGLPGEWRYADNDQYVNTKAEIIKIKGNILHNLGLMKEAVDPLLESIHLFASLQEKDEKGIASSLALLTKCLGKLSLKEYDEVKQKFPKNFETDHPCYESYFQGIKAVGYIRSLQESLYLSKDLLDADTSLLKYAVLHPSISEEYRLFQIIMKEMTMSLSAHKTVDVLRSSEQFFEFVRALFLIHQTLAFSPLLQDRSLSQYLQQLSIELYRHLCNHNKDQQVARLEHTSETVRMMNLSLTILGLPVLLGMVETQRIEQINKGEELDTETVRGNNVEQGQHVSCRLNGNQLSDFDQTGEPMDSDGAKKDEKITGTSWVTSSRAQSEPFSNQCLNEPSKDPHAAKPSPEKFLKMDSSGCTERQQNVIKEAEASRGWTYSFGFLMDGKENVEQRTQFSNTFPQMTGGKLLDPKKQWQTYKHHCVGLPVDPNFFCSPVPSDENLYKSDVEVVSVDERAVESAPLVNLSVSLIQQTVESKTNNRGKVLMEDSSSVDLEATTVPSSPFATKTSSALFLHPHDLPNQPMRRQSDRHKQNLNDDLDSSKFAPLVDLSKTTMTDSLEEMRLGESISTTDPVEYMNNWRPPVRHSDGQGCEVQRAFLMMYNPATSYWTAQSTLVFVGEPLDLAANKKGHCREAFHVQFLHQDEPRGRYVGKRYLKRHAHHHYPKRYMQDVVCQMMAGYYVIKFNEVMQNYKRDIQVQFLPAYHLQLLTPGGELEDCFNVEPYLHGDFIKLTNNLAFSNKKEHRGEELATALTHFSYCESKGALMIVDIQGWLPSESSGVIYLTDLQFHTSGMERFSMYDHQEKGMEKFWESVHPQCNDMCRAIGLKRPNK